MGLLDEIASLSDSPAWYNAPSLAEARQRAQEEPGYYYGQGALPFRVKDAPGASPEWGYLPGPLRSLLTGGMDLASSMNDALHGKPTSVTPEATLALAGFGLGAGQIAGPAESVAGMFVGPKARTWSNSQAATAELLRAQGRSPEDIWAVTADSSGRGGMFLGKDDVWRTEIPDTGAMIHPALREIPQAAIPQSAGWSKTRGQAMIDPQQFSGMTLGQALIHPALYAAYPDLAQIPLKGIAGYNSGYYMPAALGPEHIAAGPANRSDLLDVLLHEAQHVIQEREDWARGGNPKEFLPADHEEQGRGWRDLLVQHADNFYLKKVLPGVDPQSWSDPGRTALHQQLQLANPQTLQSPQMQELARMYPQDWQNYMNDVQGYWLHKQLGEQARERYMNLAGEVEARNVPARLKEYNVWNGAGADPYTSHPFQTTGYPTAPQELKLGWGLKAP